MNPNERSYDSEQLWQLEKKILQNDVLTDSELQPVRRCLESSLDEDKLLAAQGLLRHRYSAALIEAASKVATQLCAAALMEPGHFNLNLLLLLQFVPEIYLNNHFVHKFIFAAAVCPDTDARANAMIVLARLARTGDFEASKALELAKLDPNEIVSQNANSLSRAVKHAS